MSASIGVVGAAGPTGRAVIAAVAPVAETVRALIHRPSSEDAVLAAGATEATVIDLVDRTSTTAGFAGLDAVYVMAPLFDEREVEYVHNALSAAVSAGVRRFVYHSVLHPFTPTMRHHARKAMAEIEVRDGGLEWAILQPAMYAETLVTMLERAGGSDVIPLPYGLKTLFAPVSVVDVAAVAARALTDASLAYGAYELAGPERLTAAEMIDALATATGRPLVGDPVGPGRGSLPPRWGSSSIADAVAMWAHYDAHGLVGNPFVLMALLGRKPASFAEAVARRLGSANNQPAHNAS